MKSPTSLRMPSWAGYRAGKGDDASDGVMQVAFHGAAQGKAMTPLQRKALLDAEKRDAARYGALVDAILDAYPTFRPWKPRPKAMTKALLKSHVQLWEVMALADDHDGVGYAAYCFSCSWDPSGFKIITLGDRIAMCGSDVLGYPIRDPMRVPPEQHLPTDAARAKVRAAAERRAKKNPMRLRLDDLGMATVHLPRWAGHVNRPGEEPADGEIMIELDGELDFEVGPPQQAAYQHLVGHADAMYDRVCDAVVASYAKLAMHGDPDVELPKRMDRATLRDFVDLRSINLSAAERDGVAYAGYALGCRWDREHGLGVMTHLDRVVGVGDGDLILDWTRSQDRAARRSGATKKPATKKPATKKPATKKKARS